MTYVEIERPFYEIHFAVTSLRNIKLTVDLLRKSLILVS